MKKYRVWFEQINYQYVEVKANGMNEAMDKAIKKWDKECAVPEITDIKEVQNNED